MARFWQSSDGRVRQPEHGTPEWTEHLRSHIERMKDSYGQMSAIQIRPHDVLEHVLPHDHVKAQFYRRLLMDGQKTLPIVIEERPEGGYKLIDGIHRLGAAQALNKPISALLVRHNLQKMAIKDIQMGRRIAVAPGHFLGYTRFDYSHVLPSTLSSQGYRLNVYHDPSSAPNEERFVTAVLTHPKSNPSHRSTNFPGSVGSLSGHLQPDGTLKIGTASVDEEHRGGKGLPMYEALFAHAHKKLGAHTVAGGWHSTMAHKVHQKLAMKHGLDYNAGPNPAMKTPENTPTGPFDGKFDEYSYAIKAEEEMAKAIGPFIASLMMAAAPGPVDQSVEQPKHQIAATMYKPWSPEGLHEDMAPIAHLESSWGKNIAHGKGKNEMDTAFGALGFKPQTALEEYNRSKNIQKEHPNLSDPAAFLSEFRGNPQFYNKIASQHFSRLKKLHGSPEKAAFAWRWGSTAAANATPEQVEAEPYVQKYKALKSVKKLGKSQRDKETVRVVSVAAYMDGLMLFGLRGDKNKWCMPGGHMEPGEDKLDAAKRELMEETSLVGYGWEYLGSGEVPGKDITVYCYKCHVDEEPNFENDPDSEFTEFQWIDPKSFPKDLELHNKYDINLELQEIDYKDELSKAEALVKMAAKKPKFGPDDKNLIVQHNLSAGGLEHADKLGGLPAPSIAVAHKSHPLTGFGEISLVGHQDLVDPTKHPVFDADIYSPRQPRAEYKYNDKKMMKLSSELRPHFKAIGSDWVSSLGDEFKRYGPGMTRAGSYNIAEGLKHAYLKDKGVQIPEIQRDVPVSAPWMAEPAMHQFFKEHGKDQNYGHDSDYSKKLGEAARASIESWSNNLEMEPDDKQYMKELAHKEFINPDTGEVWFGKSPKMFKDHSNLGQKEPDPYKMRDWVNAKVKEMGEDDFHDWSEKKLEHLNEGQYIPKYSSYSGNMRRVPYTIDNILKEMKGNPRQGENFNYGLGSIRAGGAKKFRDLEQMRQHQGQIVSHEDFQKIKQHMDNRWNELNEELAPYHGTKMQSMSALGEAISESYKRGKYLGSQLKFSGFDHVPPEVQRKVQEFAHDLVRMPTEYFESKPQRVVGLHEFKGAAVPKNAHPRTIERLKSNGIQHIEHYDPDVEGDRARAINAIAEAQKLHLSEDEFYGETLLKELDFIPDNASLDKVALTPESTANRMTPHQVSSYEAFDKIDSYKLPNGMFHHVYYKESSNPRYQSIHHSISNYDDPRLDGIATSSSSLYPSNATKEELLGGFDNKPWNDEKPMVIHGETSSRGPKGTGTLLYQEMAKVHGRMASDSSTSAGANGVWQKLVQHPEFKGQLGPDKNHRHYVEYLGQKPVPYRSIAGDGRSIDAQIKNPNPGYTFDIQSFKLDNAPPNMGYMEAAIMHNGQRIGYRGVHLDHETKKLHTVGPYYAQRGVAGGSYTDFGHDEARGMATKALENATGYKFAGDLPSEKAEQMMKKSEELEKNRPGPKFPKLGVPDDQRPTDQVVTPRQLKIKQLAQANAYVGEQVRSNPDFYEKYPGTRQAAQQDAKRFMVRGASGALGAAPGSSGTTASYALASPWLAGPQYSNKTPAAIQLHENSHMMFRRVHDKYGQQARRNLAQNLWHHAESSVTPEEAKRVNDYLDVRYPPKFRGYDHEERMNTVLNLVNDPGERNIVAMDPKYEHVISKKTPTGRVIKDSQSLLTAAKKMHRALLEGGQVADDKWIGWHGDFLPHYNSKKDEIFKKNEALWFSDDTPGMRILALKAAKPSPDILNAALDDEHPDVRAFAAQHPALSFEQLFNVLSHKDVHTRTAALKNPNITAEHLEFAQHDPDIAGHVAQHPLFGNALAKNIGFVEFPKLGEHVHTYPMPMNVPDAKDRKTLMGDVNRKVSGGKLFFNINTNPDKRLPGKQRKMSGYVLTDNNSDAFKGRMDHEAQHSVFAHLHQRHGTHAYHAAIEHVLGALSNQEKNFLNLLNPQLAHYPQGQKGEEAIAYMQNFLQDPARRKKWLADFAPNGRRLTEVGQRRAHGMVKEMWKRMRNRAKEFGPEHIEEYKKRVRKTDTELVENWPQLIKEANLIGYNVVEDMAGKSLIDKNVLKAAEFLSGKKCDMMKFRRAFWQLEDQFMAALAAVDLEPTGENAKALKNIADLQEVKKNSVDDTIKSVKVVFSEDQKIADAIQRGIDSRSVQAPELEGKHVGGIRTVEDPQSREIFLMKPGSGAPSPAKGVRQQIASPSEREACFYAVAKLLGLQDRMVETYLLNVDGKFVAAMRMLPHDWTNLEKLKFQNKTLPASVLEKYRITGELHVWGILDYILGNPDRHGQNLMVGPLDDNYPVVMIDHGSALAGDGFDPANDEDSFIPYYFRAWNQKAFKNTDEPAKKLKVMPRTSDAGRKYIEEFIQKLNPSEIEGVLVKYGVDPSAIIARIEKVKHLLSNNIPLDEGVNQLWVV